MFDRTYVRESAFWLSAMIGGLLLALWLSRVLEPGSPLRYLALLPYVVTLVGMCWSELRQVARMDEMQRLIYLHATLAGTVLFSTFCAVAYVGELVQLWPRVAPLWGIAAMGLGFLAGLKLARRHYAG